MAKGPGYEVVVRREFVYVDLPGNFSALTYKTIFFLHRLLEFIGANAKMIGTKEIVDMIDTSMKTRLRG